MTKEKKVKGYTILLGGNLWENVIDDMNSTAIWAMGGMLWPTRDKAVACMKHLKNPAYDFESRYKAKFSVAKVEITLNKKKK